MSPRPRIGPPGPAALKLLAAGDFDAAVLDWDLPDADGLSLLAPLRASGVLVLMASGRAQAADRALALGSGADDYLSKPFSAASLIARLRALLQA
ncbi:MAG: response regulator transcription factor [Elusimicrobia bacterium]|nr:response regulator transcription factor [Elusimicrobiota bacterium]